MRISDWSSDVCSSDLVDRAGGPRRPDRRSGARPGRDGGMTIAADVRYGAGEVMATMKAIGLDVGDYRLSIYSLFASLVVAVLLYAGVRFVLRAVKWLLRRNSRSDEHTSELQSVMRNT